MSRGAVDGTRTKSRSNRPANQQPRAAWVGIAVQTPAIFGTTRPGSSWNSDQGISNCDGGFWALGGFRSTTRFDGASAGGAAAGKTVRVLCVGRGGGSDRRRTAEGHVRSCVSSPGSDARENGGAGERRRGACGGAVGWAAGGLGH